MKLVSYANCQLFGVLHFLKQSKLAGHCEFKHYNNFQIILREQSAADLFEDSAQADIFVFQPTPAIQYCELSTEQMIESVVPNGALKISVGYGFNHGLFPIVHHGQWQTGRQVLQLAKDDPATLRIAYDHGTLKFDCALRFIACLNEQARREKAIDIKMSDFILAEFQKQKLFICENHPASAYLAELARRVLRFIEIEMGLRLEPETVTHTGDNDANLPCGMLVSPYAVSELDLQYPAEQGAHKYFGEFIERLITEKQTA